MESPDTLINNVADTALWVAYYRAKESKKADALFRDPLAELLIGDRGEKIAMAMKKAGRHSEYTVIMRTVIIDDFITEVVKEGIDTVINLGAGMDTRPYRMVLPATLKWIEVDQSQVIVRKNELLRNEVPAVQLSRLALDLSDDIKRKEFLAKCAAGSERILVITEGVIPYLTETQVAGLARDLASFEAFEYWIAEYMDPRIYPYLKTPERAKRMRNAPFVFFPENWTAFFSKNGWTAKETRYFAVEGEKRGRMRPTFWWAFWFKIFAPKKVIEVSKRMAGFMLLKRNN